ncbi:RHS repeat protein [Aequorivita viscosa]|nr:RHS repeat protein [Aequorivita viscosa]
MTTYTYDPLYGVKTITDPKGDAITYHYDTLGRLEYVTDKDGKRLSENEYNYRPQL